MAKANRVCYCCGREYYFCPSCPKDKKDPQIYTMWDSEECRDIFNTLSSESLKKITTKECKEKLIELGVDKIEINKESVKNHINRVMNYTEDIKEAKEIEEVKEEIKVLETSEVLEASEVSEVTEVTEVTEEIKIEKTETVEVVEIVESTEPTEVIEETPKIISRKRKGSYRTNNK